MAFCCSDCSFTAQFESALIMHRQLHHDTDSDDVLNVAATNIYQGKSNTVPRSSSNMQYSSNKDGKGFKLPTRTSSATRLFDKLRARICKSRTLFSHPEENIVHCNANVCRATLKLLLALATCDSSGVASVYVRRITNLHAPSECTSKALNADCLSRCSAITTTLHEGSKETYGCHLCSFDADRITVLDRHLLNEHRIGLDTLLNLVMAKTKDGLTEESPSGLYGIRQPYYKPQDEIIEEGEFVIETVTPKIKILKHVSTNTDIRWVDIPDLKNNCRMITEELDKMISPTQCNNEDFINKMQTLNKCMCKFVDSSNMLKKVLTKEFDSKSARERLHGKDPFFDLGLGDRDTPRDWNRAQSEKMERNRVDQEENRRDNSKVPSESFYF